MTEPLQQLTRRRRDYFRRLYPTLTFVSLPFFYYYYTKDKRKETAVAEFSYPFFYYYVVVAVQANKEKRIAISIDGRSKEETQE